jgi:Ankyrin repeats (3 copies)
MMEACTGVREEAILIDVDEPEVLPATDAVAVALIAAIHSGDDESLSQILIERRELATARILDRRGVTRTLLHVVADWPGYFPNGPRTVERLLAAGADPDAATTGGRQPETPLHWAASSDDLEVADALIAGGAAIDVPGGSIGTPVENAVGYGCWHVARLLRARGAKVDALWVAPGWACFRSCGNTSSRPRRPTAAISITLSGRPATAASSASRLTCWSMAPTSTRRPITTTPVPSRSRGRQTPARGLLIEWLAKHERR